MEYSKLRAAVVQIVTTLILIISVLILYVGYSENRAEKRANEFCNRLEVGQETGRLLEHALAAGADDRRSKWHVV